MKAIKSVMGILLLLILSASSVWAAERGVNGLVFGAGSGALIGQAIGRDTDATLLGTAVGGVLGYIIGNEMDKTGFPVTAGSYSYPPRVYKDRRYSSLDDEYRTECREAEVLGTINGRPKRIYTTVCRDEDGRWIVQGDDPVVMNRTVIINKYHRTKWQGGSYYPRHRSGGRDHWKRW